MRNINSVVIAGNLTKDPDLRHTGGGTSVCGLRVACNGIRKDSSGDWVDDPNYFDVTVWGKQGEICAEHLSKGSGVCVQGRLNWREWETDQGGKRQAVDIVAEQVQFTGGKRDGDGGSRGRDEREPLAQQGGGRSSRDDDIPF